MENTRRSWTGPARTGRRQSDHPAPLAGRQPPEITPPKSDSSRKTIPRLPNTESCPPVVNPADGCIRIAQSMDRGAGITRGLVVEKWNRQKASDDVEAGCTHHQGPTLSEVIDKLQQGLLEKHPPFEPRSMSVHAWPTAGTEMVLRIALRNCMGPTAGDDCPDGRVGESVEKQGT